MDGPAEGESNAKPQDDPPPCNEAAIRAMLEQSRRDIAEGRIVPMKPVLERMRAVAEQLRREKGRDVATGRRPA